MSAYSVDNQSSPKSTIVLVIVPVSVRSRYSVIKLLQYRGYITSNISNAFNTIERLHYYK